MKQRRKCLDCGHIWQPSALGVCPWCGSSSSEENPKDDPYMREVVIPRLRHEEEFFEEQMVGMVKGHPAWEWPKDVLGAGLTSVGRIIGKTDIARINTASEMWAHCGWGLEKDGTRQRKHKGEPISYDAQLQSNCVMVGESLMKASVRKRCAQCHTSFSSSDAKCVKCGQIYTRSKKTAQCPQCGESKAITGQCPSCESKETEEYAIAAYGQFYLDQKEANSDLPKAHCHNRAFRHMIKLFLSHLWLASGHLSPLADMAGGRGIAGTRALCVCDTKASWGAFNKPLGNGEGGEKARGREVTVDRRRARKG